ncbi:MAG: endo-1,4-beta-xylanase [Marinoscillum sp.]|uniref:endo-1,4-beta-xylanase n=1 Tax=Marinoscillum sp. TaxID=2024838 RepID=UPI0032F6A968
MSKRGLLLIGLVVMGLMAKSQEKPIADGMEKFLGNVYSSSQLSGYETYWNQVTPENAGKWGSVERTRDSYNWTTMDAAYNFAKENNFVFRYHVLIWGNQQPSWIEDLPVEEQLEEITEWMDAVAERYPDMDYLEVVNEPINDPPTGAGNGNYMDALGGRGATGYDWIVTAFTMARERFPNAKLVINEYNIVSSSSNANKYKKIIELLQADDLIDVVGVQAHAFSTTGSSSTITDQLDKLGDTGLPIMVTEMDIDGATDQVQLDEYKRIFPLFWEHESVIGVTLWGWRSGMWRTAEKAYLVNTDGTERPALEWLRAYASQPIDNTVLGWEDDYSNLQLFPNPVVNGQLTIRSPEPVRQVTLYDLSGHQVADFSHDMSREVNLTLDLSSGIYLMKVQGSAKSESRRLVIK